MILATGLYLISGSFVIYTFVKSASAYSGDGE